MQQKCECTYQTPKCEEGWRLEGESMAAHTVWQNAPLSQGTSYLVELHDKFTACLKAYFEHVKTCSIHA